MTPTSTGRGPIGSVRTFDTADGPFTVIVNPEGAVIASGWTDSAALLWERLSPVTAGPGGVGGERVRLPMPLMGEGGVGTVGRAADIGLARAEAAVREFYRAHRASTMRVTDVPVAQAGTDFQRAGWRALRDIPAGHRLSYAQFAASFATAQAVRAAASVCARNAVALFVPCHRVVRSDGSLGQFAWGADVKASVLERESAWTQRI